MLAILIFIFIQKCNSEITRNEVQLFIQELSPRVLGDSLDGHRHRDLLHHCPHHSRTPDGGHLQVGLSLETSSYRFENVCQVLTSQSAIRVKNGFYLIVGIIDIGSFPILTLIVSGLIEPFSISHSLFLMNCQKIIEILTKATSISPLLLGLIDDRYWFSIPQ